MNSPKKTRSRLIAPLLIGIAALGGFGFWSHLHEAHGQDDGHHHGATHEHGSANESALTLDNGKRWQTDEALRTGMQRIRDAAARVLRPGAPAIATKQFAATVQESVEYLVKNCKLSPKADAALHVIITDLMTGASQLAENPASAEGAELVTRALQRYPEYFDHPGWTPLPAREPRG